MEAKKLAYISIADYLNIEQESDTRYEYHDGKIFAMAGGSIEHGLISGNIYSEITFALRQHSSPCRAINNEGKLYVEASNTFLYPDMMVSL